MFVPATTATATAYPEAVIAYIAQRQHQLVLHLRREGAVVLQLSQEVEVVNNCRTVASFWYNLRVRAQGPRVHSPRGCASVYAALVLHLRREGAVV